MFYRDRFDLLKDSVYNPLPKQTEFAPIAIQRVPEDTTQKGNVTVQQQQAPEQQPVRVKKAKVFYTVKKGDNLRNIADWFDVTEAEVKEWNKLKGTNVPKGKKLQVFVPKNKTGYYKRINSMSAAQKKKLTRKD